jgi:hypothetical protein
MRQRTGSAAPTDPPPAAVAAIGVRSPARWPPAAAAVSLAVAVSVGLVASGCSLHVSKHQVSGNLFGHSFSGANGSLPTGFPADVPVPDNSRVLIGGGTDNHWDVAFAVTGSIAPGTAAYESKLRSSGYVITNVKAGSSPVTDGSASNAGSPSTTVTVTGSIFTADNAKWTVQVESASTTSAGNGLRAGEFAVNITVVPTSSAPPGT